MKCQAAQSSASPSPFKIKIKIDLPLFTPPACMLPPQANPITRLACALHAYLTPSLLLAPPSLPLPWRDPSHRLHQLLPSPPCPWGLVPAAASGAEAPADRAASFLLAWISSVSTPCGVKVTRTIELHVVVMMMMKVTRGDRRVQREWEQGPQEAQRSHTCLANLSHDEAVSTWLERRDPSVYPSYPV